MSNPYPNRVSVNDPHIVGYPEREVRIERDCDNDEWQPADGLPGLATCGFSGHVDVTEHVVYRTNDEIVGNRQWTCPRCGKEYVDEEQVLAERDPDEGRD